MAKYDDKYGFEETKQTPLFHQARRMFCIKDGELYIAQANLPYSHAVWFEKEGWITHKKDSLMNEVTRGFVDTKGDVHFYVGYDFKVTNKTFQDMISHLAELVKKLNLNREREVYGGRRKNTFGQFESIKCYGKINRLLKDSKV